MCKKLTKLVKDSEAMKEELAKYRSLYGDVNASLTVEEVRGRRGGRKDLDVSVRIAALSRTGSLYDFTSSLTDSD